MRARNSATSTRQGSRREARAVLGRIDRSSPVLSFAMVALLLVSVTGSALVAPAPAAAAAVAPVFERVILLECSDTGEGDTAKRGVDICYEPSTRVGGDTVEHRGDYELEYEYNSNNPLMLPTIRINKFERDGDDRFGGGPPDAGLVASLDIVYPLRSPLQGDDQIYVGEELKKSSFVLVQADDFDFTKSFVDVDGKPVVDPEDGNVVGIRYDFDFTFVAVSFRDGCGFVRGQFPFEAKSECESENGGNHGNTEDWVANHFSFDPSNPMFTPATMDGGFINFHAQEGTTFISDGSEGRPVGVGWMIVGPAFNEAGEPNTGTAQLFLAAAHREQVFGADFVVSGTSGVSVERQDRVGDDVETESVLDVVTVTERRGGLLITIEEYGFSAPFFQVSASDESASGAQAGASAPDTSLAVSCEGTRAVGSEVTCTVSGGAPGIDILWQAAYNPVFAGAGVMLDADGNGTFSFTVPSAALGQELTVELVAWLAPVSLGVAGGPVPASVPAGGGPMPVWPFVMLALAGGLVVARRPAALRLPAARCR